MENDAHSTAPLLNTRDENVSLRERELSKCQAIIGDRAAALMARFTPRTTENPRPVASPEPAWGLGAMVGCQS